MAAESVGMSQKKKDRAATIGMIIFFSILAILTVLPIYLLVLASFKPGNFLLQYGLNLNLDIPHLTLDNYKLLFTGKHDYWTWFGNSLILTSNGTERIRRTIIKKKFFPLKSSSLH